jgi:hypothetical protein
VEVLLTGRHSFRFRTAGLDHCNRCQVALPLQTGFAESYSLPPKYQRILCLQCKDEFLYTSKEKGGEYMKIKVNVRAGGAVSVKSR